METKIIKYDDLGNGICKIDNKVCFVKKGIPEEKVDIRIIKENKKYNQAIINKIIEKSKKRIIPKCLYYDKCGGCNFLHINNEEEINFKINKINNYFHKIDNFYKTKRDGYRNKIVFHVKNGDIGFFSEKSNDLVKINHCYLISSKMNKILEIFNKNKDLNFNGTILIRENYQQETIVGITGKYNFINNLKDNILINNLIYNDKVIKGKNYFIENILSYKFKVSYKSFFQVNRIGLEKIFEILDNFFKNNKINNALDLYSGTSVLGIFISKYVKNVISVEMNSMATNDALENKKLNNINNLEIINGLVEDYIDTFNNIDFIILDPARRGLDKKTIEYLIKIKPKYIIYIACGIDSLKRDLHLLNDNYYLNNIYGIDMFPSTNNIESVAILKKI